MSSKGAAGKKRLKTGSCLNIGERSQSAAAVEMKAEDLQQVHQYLKPQIKSEEVREEEEVEIDVNIDYV